MDLLGRFGFGFDFRKWIGIFYLGVNMRIILNGWFLKFIMLMRGVR